MLIQIEDVVFFGADLLLYLRTNWFEDLHGFFVDDVTNQR